MVSRCGEGLALLRRIQSEGYDCDFWVRPGIARDLYDGLIPRVDFWRDGLDSETAVLFDCAGSGKTVAEIPRSWGAGALNDVLQFDPAFGMGIAKIHGLNVPSEESPDQGQDETLTLQGWYVKGELVTGSLFSTIEPNRFLAGNYGPRCQSPLCLGWFWRPKKKRDGETTPTLYRQTLKRLEPFLKEQKYSGPLCLKLRMEKDGKPVLLAFETGLRYPALYAMLEGLQPQGSIGECLAAMSQGEMAKLQPSFDWLGVLALSVPPYPCYAGRANVSVEGEILENPHVWPLDVKQVAGEVFTAGAHGIVAHVTAQVAQREALNSALYRLSESIAVADKQLRSDGLDSNNLIGLLKEWHYF